MEYAAKLFVVYSAVDLYFSNRSFSNESFVKLDKFTMKNGKNTSEASTPLSFLSRINF